MRQSAGGLLPDARYSISCARPAMGVVFSALGPDMGETLAREPDDDGGAA
jgi:hypothetical protein